MASWKAGAVAQAWRAMCDKAGSRTGALHPAIRGVGWMMLAAFGSSAMNGIIRVLSADLHAFEIAFFRNLFALIVLLPLIWRAGAASLRTTRPGLHVLRGVLNAVSMLSFFYAVTVTPLATVAALNFTAPLFASVLAALLLREMVGLRRIVGILVGFSGALVILRPGIAAPSAGELLVLLSSAAWAAALIDIKILARTDTPLTITAYAAFFLTPICLVAAIPFWTWPDLTGLGLLALCGILGNISQISIAKAFSAAETTQVLPGDFTKLLWAALIGYVFFAELPDVWTFLGGTLIFASVLYVAYREARVRPASAQAGRSAGA
ncbi:DMT family transporter [Marinimicrococcus flavescens]|uniref:DMT family transporter n=1 Tax=Marinimicrococcus flavescens TaxID=3031815 RepID=A0AAP3XT80_9PROT|nr:DMT family transporter [Marinimicrococcus flavescens]